MKNGSRKILSGFLAVLVMALGIWAVIQPLSAACDKHNENSTSSCTYRSDNACGSNLCVVSKCMGIIGCNGGEGTPCPLLQGEQDCYVDQCGIDGDCHTQHCPCEL